MSTEGPPPPPPPPPISVLLVTHNVSGIFDDLDGRLDPWVAELVHLVEGHRADFVALHLQEIGGSAWAQEGIGGASRLLAAVHAAFSDFWSSGLLCNPNTKEHFSALGSLYLVRRSALDRVSVWDYAAGDFRRLAELPSPLLRVASVPDAYCRHQRFPAHFFPEPLRWSRKGFLLTRWRLGPRVADMLNVHLFHDDSNLLSLQRTSGGSVAEACQSVYANRRHAALRHTLREVEAEAMGASARARPALFAFGDFNFRLDLPAVVLHLCGPHGLARALAHDNGAGPVQLRSPAAEAAGPPPAGPGGQAEEEWVLELGAKRFSLTAPWELWEQARTFRSFDRELDELNRVAGTPMLELPIAFPPSYMYTHVAGADALRGSVMADEAARGPAPRRTLAPPGTDASVFHLGRKRCPSWCDRVLFDATGLTILHASPSAATYSAQSQGSAVLCDHNKVFLAFEIE